MLAVEKWAKGKSPFIAAIAPQVASAAQDIHKAFLEVKDRSLLGFQFELPHLPTWYKLYRCHHKLDLFIKQLITRFSIFSPDTLSVAELMLNCNKPQYRVAIAERQQEMALLAPQDRVALVEKAKEVLDNIVAESFRDIGGDLTDELVSLQDREAFLEMIGASEASFFFLVSIPCWTLYQESPTRLYRKARCGDYDSLEKLIRLDPLIIHDHSIGKQVQRLRFAKKRVAFETLMDAIHRKPKVKLTRKKMKYALAGFISALSVALKTPLDEPQIRALFDAVAQDYLKTPIDIDLSDSPESFAKALQRNRKPWLAILDRT